VGPEPAICLKNFAAGALTVAQDLPDHVLAWAKVEATSRGGAACWVKRSGIHRGSISVIASFLIAAASGRREIDVMQHGV
jgi:hypothetical protein